MQEDWHSVSKTGDLELHTLKLNLKLSNMGIRDTVSPFALPKTKYLDISIGYKRKSSHDKIEFYLLSPDIQKISFETITICTENSCTLYKQCITIRSYSSSLADWYYFAHILPNSITLCTMNIFIKILHKQDGPDFSDLLNDPIYSDATIVSNDGVAIKVHKCIVAARCDVLKAHFTHSSSSAIQSDFEEKVLRELLKYIYRGIKAVDKDSVTEALFVAADFYQLDELKNFCEYSLCEQLTEDNVVHSLMFANTHSAVHLINLAMDFIDSHARLIFTKPAWADLNSIEIVKALYEKTKENETKIEHKN